MKNFALIGAAGYIAPRHMEAIKATGNNLVAAYDKSDSVGVIDRYFPNSDFFTEFERFDRHIDKLRRRGTKIDFFSICSPNYLHDAHIRFALRYGADVICEKPLVLNPWSIDRLKAIEEETGRTIYTILQLRLHQSVIQLKKKVEQSPPGKIFDIDLSYLTSRGKWYYASWKGDESKSGGIAANIGVHFYDMLTWIFGEVEDNIVHIKSHDRASGFLKLKKANVRWFLSINHDCLPDKVKEKGLTTYRSLTIENEEFEFSGGFTELHTRSYEAVLRGDGFLIDENRPAIKIVYDIRKLTPQGLVGNYHPFAEIPLVGHPFGWDR